MPRKNSTASRKIFDSGFAAQADLDNLRTARDQLLASIERTEALIAQKSVYAPWDGKLGLRSISVGKYVAPGQTVVWLQTVDPIYADFTVTEEDYGRIADGQKVTARFNAYPDAPVQRHRHDDRFRACRTQAA